MAKWQAVVLAVILTIVSGSAVSGAYLRVVSWNTLHSGWSGQTNWSRYAGQAWGTFGTNPDSPNGVDVIFAQEVMYAESAASIAQALSARSGAAWDYRVTAALGRSSYKERYAVFYRPDRVQILAEYVWNDVGDHFEREPQIVKLRHIQTGADYTFINWHTVFGTTANRRAEIEQIATVFDTVRNSNASDYDVILVGDHNRDADSPWWTSLTSLSPTVEYKVNEYTSINTSCGYASRYDHFWLQPAYVTEYSSSGRDYIADMCAFRNNLSDHAPIYLRLYSSYDDD